MLEHYLIKAATDKPEIIQVWKSDQKKKWQTLRQMNMIIHSTTGLIWKIWYKDESIFTETLKSRNGLI